MSPLSGAPSSLVPRSSRLILSGHSSGAVVSTIAAVDLQRDGYNVVANINFESPLVYNATMAAC